MKFKSLAFAVATVASGSAYAADLAVPRMAIAPPPVATSGFDFAFGASVFSDYIYRGVSQSDRKPSATAYVEPQYKFNDNFAIFGRIQAYKINQPTNPLAEIDLVPGVRLTFGDFGLDLGAQYYWYPANKDRYWSDFATFTYINPSYGPFPAGLPAAARCPAPGGFCATTPRDPSYVEIFAKPTYAINSSLSVSGNLFYAPNWLNFRTQALYSSIGAKYAFGETGFSVSGEYGYFYVRPLRAGTELNSFGSAEVRLPKYTTWNLGASYTWKQFSLDARYVGSTLNKNACYLISADPNGNRPGQIPTQQSNWCGHRFVVSLNMDFVASKDVGFLPK